MSFGTHIAEGFLAQRREKLRAQRNPVVNGIERVEVSQADRALEVHFVHPLTVGDVAQADADSFTFQGGDSIRNIVVQAVTPTGPATMRLHLDQFGDFSVYELIILALDAQGRPARDPEQILPGLDPMLARIRFGFQVECPSDFDCHTGEYGGDLPTPEQPINTLAKDYDSFRRVMNDHLARVVPGHRRRDAADTAQVMVELLAYWADHLSYAQDAVATEAYMSTARRRASVRRHARLLGYEAHDGLSARGFVQVMMRGAGQYRVADLAFLTGWDRAPGTHFPAGDIDLPGAVAEGVQVFEPLKRILSGASDQGAEGAGYVFSNDGPEVPYQLDEAHNRLDFHDWGIDHALLPKGATRAWLRVPTDGAAPPRAGSYLCLELLRDPLTGRAADADPAMRQIVCLTHDAVLQTDHLSATPDLWRIDWHGADALTFDLPISQQKDASGSFTALAACFGNVIPVDHGAGFAAAEVLPLPPDQRDPETRATIQRLSDLDRPRPFAPQLRARDISVTAPLRISAGPHNSAAAVLEAAAWQGGQKAISLRAEHGGGDIWRAVPSLIHARADDAVFVAETEVDGTTSLRFGGGDLGGMHPDRRAGSALVASYRLGLGDQGNIGADSIAHVMLKGVNGPVGARNPLPMQGGRDRESLPEIRANALAALDQNRRAVTRSDYARLASEHDRVQQAHVRSIGHGAWDTIVVAIDPAGQVEADDALLEEVRTHLEPFRLMGQDLIVERPRFAPLEIDIAICPCAGFLGSDVRKAVMDRLSSGVMRDGQRGFFHPDNFSFGAPVYHSHLIAAVHEVPGVADLRITRFGRWRQPGQAAQAAGVIHVTPEEIPILMNNPSLPERGVLRVVEWNMA